MSPVTLVTQRGRGFARLGPSVEPLNRGITAAMEQRGYESEASAGDIWLRYRPRRTGFREQYCRVAAVVSNDPAAAWNVDWADGLDPRYDAVGRIADLAGCRDMVSETAGDPPFRFLYHLDGALCLCPRADRMAFLRRCFFPAFFARFPAGRVVVIGTDSAFESRLPLLRLGNYFQINGPAAYADMRAHNLASPQTATGIHSSGAVALDKMLGVILGNLMPLRTHFVGGRLGARVVYLFGDPDPPVIDRGPFPRDEAELYGSQSFFQTDTPDLAAPADPAGGWLGRFRNAAYPGDDATVALLSALVERINWHVSNRLEVCNFVDNDTIDFVECFEKYLTFDRVLHECNMVAATTSPAAARLMTFAVLDKFQEVCRFAGVQAGRGFHHMCTRPFLGAVLRPAFARLPAPWDTHFQTAADRLYDELYAAVRSPRGVWPNFLVEPGGVRVYREWDRAARQFVTPAPATFTDDEFVAEYVRSARNTHHGYVSDGDHRRRFACFGSLSTGFLPDSFTQLPLLVLLAELLHPERLSGHHWLDQATLTIDV